MNINIRGLDQLQRKTDDVKKALSSVPEKIKEVLRRDFRAAASEARPQVPARSGGLRKRFGSSVSGGTARKPEIKAVVGFIRRAQNQHEAVAPNVLEKGATIRPKKGRFLWIPIGSNVDAAGHAKERPFIAQTFIMKTHGGNLIAFKRQRAGEVGPPSPMFLLRQEVVIPAHPIIAPLERKLVPQVERDIEAEIEKLDRAI